MIGSSFGGKFAFCAHVIKTTIYVSPLSLMLNRLALSVYPYLLLSILQSGSTSVRMNVSLQMHDTMGMRAQGESHEDWLVYVLMSELAHSSSPGPLLASIDLGLGQTAAAG